ncbi:hypothetical protein M5K25_013460 [Dendrobium thyrsiflorum]|uniref:Uncharacterized protein n=1 Tax=Dendrobium thyrsiflorum TaxID=117978 RepID=A0ABD0V0E1_DENTH
MFNKVIPTFCCDSSSRVLVFYDNKHWDDPLIVLDNVLQSCVKQSLVEVRCPGRKLPFVLIVQDDREIGQDDREIGQDDQANFESSRTFSWMFRESFLRVFSIVHTCHWVEGKRGRAWEREEEAYEGEFVRCSQRLLLAKVQSVFSVRHPESLKTLEVSTSARRNGSLPASGGSKRSDGSLPASGGSERSSGSLPHWVGGKSVLFLHHFSPHSLPYFLASYSLQTAGGKRSRQEPGSSSSGKSDPRFLNAEDKAAYARYKLAGITFSKIINPATLSYPVMDLFAHTSLCFFLTLACPFNVELLYQFFASLRINYDYTSLQSYIGKRPVEINYEDFETILHLSTSGDKLHTFASDPDFNWTPINQFLQNTTSQGPEIAGEHPPDLPLPFPTKSRRRTPAGGEISGETERSDVSGQIPLDPGRFRSRRQLESCSWSRADSNEYKNTQIRRLDQGGLILAVDRAINGQDQAIPWSGSAADLIPLFRVPSGQIQAVDLLGGGSDG